VLCLQEWRSVPLTKTAEVIQRLLEDLPAGGRFLRYCYADIAEAQHPLVTEALGLDARLVLGTSMGGMQLDVGRTATQK
jgi:hypothetical protein